MLFSLPGVYLGGLHKSFVLFFFFPLECPPKNPPEKPPRRISFNEFIKDSAHKKYIFYNFIQQILFLPIHTPKGYKHVIWGMNL